MYICVCKGTVMINVSHYAVFRRLIKRRIIRCLIELFKRLKDSITLLQTSSFYAQLFFTLNFSFE